MSRQTIILVEDEPDIAEVISYNLQREGFHVVSIPDGAEAWPRIRKEKPALVILDLMLPGMDGLEICRLMKADEETRSIPVIMVTAKGEESDVVLGLGLGADDYVKKPFSPREVVARVKAVLRRRKDPPPSGPLRFEGVVIDAARHEVRVDEEIVELTATEFRLLKCMAAQAGRVFTREQLIRRAIGEDAVVLERNIDVHVRSLRKKLGSRRDYLKTIRGVGYRFVGPTA